MGDFRDSTKRAILAFCSFPLNYKAIVDVFLEHLPQDLVPYWDFDFNDDFPSDKDSSSLAIAACGLLEAEKWKRILKQKK